MSATQPTNSRNPLRLLLHIPVPWVFIITYLLGACFEQAFPLPFAVANIPRFHCALCRFHPPLLDIIGKIGGAQAGYLGCLLDGLDTYVHLVVGHVEISSLAGSRRPPRIYFMDRLRAHAEPLGTTLGE